LAFEDTVLPIKVTTDTAQLKQLIRDFDGSTEAAEKLKAATNDVNESVNTQKRAIIAVNSATRVQQFQYIEGLRLLRSTTSLFANLNSVYQTTILRQIAATQTTVAQQQAFEGVIRFAGNYVNALGILGPANEEVKAGLDDLISRADSLDSKGIETLIEAFIRAGSEANLSGEGLVKFNEGLALLKKLLEETKLEEKNKEFENFLGTMLQLGQTAGALGTFATALNATATGAKALNLALATSPYILAFFAALELLNVAGVIDTPTIGSLVLGKTSKEIRDMPGVDADIQSRFATGEASSRIQVNINNPTFNSEIDLERSIDIIEARLLEKRGFSNLG